MENFRKAVAHFPQILTVGVLYGTMGYKIRRCGHRWRIVPFLFLFYLLTETNAKDISNMLQIAWHANVVHFTNHHEFVPH
jgi:hypothetical protein